MSYQEEIDALRDKISKYENLLEKVMDGPFMEGVVISQHNGLYRVMVNGNEVIIPESPKLTDNPKTGDKVMVNKNMIICILPEELEKPVKPVEFERIKQEIPETKKKVINFTYISKCGCGSIDENKYHAIVPEDYNDIKNGDIVDDIDKMAGLEDVAGTIYKERYRGSVENHNPYDYHVW